MEQDMAEARGRVMIRPWRVGVLVDTSSADAVRDAIANLSSVWGGGSMPILDIGAPTAELEQLGDQYDVDSLYAEGVEGALADFLRRPGWRWTGRGPWGPFGEEHGFRKGLLPIRSFLNASTDFVQPTWEQDDPADLLLAANFGLPDRIAVALSSNIQDIGPRTVPYAGTLTRPDLSRSIVGTIAAGSAHIRQRMHPRHDSVTGLYVIRPSKPEDVVEFWNLRACGAKIVGIPSDGPDALSALLASELPSVELPTVNGSTGLAERAIHVWGLEDASATTSKEVQSAADRDGLSVRTHTRGGWGQFGFQELRTSFTRSVRADFRPEALWIDLPLPALALSDDADAHTRGVVAADIKIHNVSGQDPRLTASTPPYRRHSSIIQHALAREGVDHLRVTRSGVALGIDADRDHARFPFAYNQEVLRVLFDDESVSTSQSDVGKFQSRAAAKFGGPFSGILNQPGTRAAVELASAKNAGVALPHLRQVVADNRGTWPDSLFGQDLEPKEYASRQVNYLLHSGLFIPTLRVHCSHCRVEMHSSADDLSTTMTCEFCGHAFNLALSHSLAQPEWRYRLAGHLRGDQIQALLPALATTSFLSQLRHVEEPPIPYVLGLEVAMGKRRVEVDVAAYLPEPDWTFVLGEVKTANRFDANDIVNFEFLQQRLAQKNVRCVLLFATLKGELTPDEISDLRALVERSRPVQVRGGTQLPNLPLVLTGPDLSHPVGSEDHPWRWDSKNYSGVFGTSITSCERNLGLRTFTYHDTGNGLELKCEWDSP